MFRNSVIIALFVYLLGFSSSLRAQQDTTQQVDYQRKNSVAAQAKPYVMLLSLDGFRWDLAKKYNAQNILALAEQGVQADKLIPTYPTLTFPNHYSLVTGQYPAQHGLVDNNFYDPNTERYYQKSNSSAAVDSTWYGGQPLWMLAEGQQMLSAVYFWPGSEFSRNGFRPSYYYKYNEITPMPRRMGVIAEWLKLPADRQPHFIAVYFPEVDKAAHRYTTESEQTKAAVLEMDAMLGELRQIIAQSELPINLFIVSDHGMTSIDQTNTIAMPKALETDKVVVYPGTTMLNVHIKDKSQIKGIYKALNQEADGYQVYLRDKTPKTWRVRSKDDIHNRMGDIILVPNMPRVFNFSTRPPSPGQHGYYANHPDMGGIFYAAGPQLKAGLHIPAFENVHLYPLMAEILGLKITEPIDGKLKVLKKILK